jgi:hypothetical protein
MLLDLLALVVLHDEERIDLALEAADGEEQFVVSF